MKTSTVHINAIPHTPTVSIPHAPIVPTRHSLIAAIALASVCALAHPAAAAFRYWDAADTSKAPKTLTATGLYADIRAGRLVAEAKPFEVNSALWSDGAHKKRWVLLKPGTSIAFSERDDYWGYPDSTVFIKQFALDTVPGDTTSRRVWETRLMINQREILDPVTGSMTDHWYGFSYKWNAAGTDAQLVEFKDVHDQIRVYPQGRGRPAVLKKWTFPAQSCERCHVNREYDGSHARSVLGFFTAQLNRPSSANITLNQLDDLFAKGVLKGAKPAHWQNSPRWRALDDSAASMNVRARSYLAANCSGCHGTRGNAVSAASHCNINFDYQNLNDSLFEFRHRYSGGFGSEDSLPKYYLRNDAGNNPNGFDSLEIQPALIVPGFPQKSAIVARQRARNTRPDDFDPEGRAMPPVGSFEVHDPAMVLLSKWILAMPATPAPGSEIQVSLGRHGRTQRVPMLRGRILTIPEGAVTEAEVSMIGLDGRVLRLRPRAPGVYAIPADAPRGLYFIRAGMRTFRHYLL